MHALACAYNIHFGSRRNLTPVKVFKAPFTPCSLAAKEKYIVSSEADASLRNNWSMLCKLPNTALGICLLSLRTGVLLRTLNLTIL